MSDAINLTLSNGDSPSIVVSAASTVSALVATPNSSVSVGVNSTPSSTVSLNPLSATAQLTVETVNTNVTSIPQLGNTITVSTSVVEKTKLRELLDVFGVPTSQQVLVYDAGDDNFVFANQAGSAAAGGTQVTDAFIDVTNTDGAFETIFDQSYEAGTSVTTILRQILNPYVEATLTLSHLTYNDETASQSGVLSSSVDVEVGSNISLEGLSFSTTNAAQIQEGSIKLLQDGATLGSLEGFAEEGFAGNFSDIGLTPQTVEHDTPTTKVFKIVAVDVGSSEIGTTYDIVSSTKSLSWKYRILLSTSPTLLVSGADSDFYNIMNQIGSENTIDDTAFDATGAFSLVTGTASDESDKYTYIAYPKSLGVITSIIYDNFTITGDFTFIDEFSYTNAGSLAQSYYIYRSNQAQFAGAGWKLEITTN